MTLQIATVLVILVVAIILFVSEKLRSDVVALLVLGALVVAGLVTPEQALSGFSNPAVVTVWAVFILSGGLLQTGVADRIGHGVLRLSGPQEWRLILILMTTAALLSGFMNNIAVAAMFVPVAVDIARRTGLSPAKLLMPLAFATLLGGMTTLISTPGNLLVSGMLAGAGLQPFGFFDFTTVGLILVATGILYMVLVGRRRIPVRKTLTGMMDDAQMRKEQFEIDQRLAILRLPDDAILEGRNLAATRIGQALGLTVLSIRRGDEYVMAPEPETVLHGGDAMLALGQLDRLEQLSRERSFEIVDRAVPLADLIDDTVCLVAFRVDNESHFAGRHVEDLNLRRSPGLNILAIRRDGLLHRSNLREVTLAVGDRLLAQCRRADLDKLKDYSGLHFVDEHEAIFFQLRERLLLIRIPDSSYLVGQTLTESRLANVFGLVVLGLYREGKRLLAPAPQITLQKGDQLMVEGNPEDLAIVRGLQELQITRDPDVDLETLTNGPMALVEATLSPYTTVADKTLRELHFRDRYGLNVLAVWHQGRPYRSLLSDRALKLGDALLLYGRKGQVQRLREDPDFLLLDRSEAREWRYEKAPIAALLMVAVVLVTLIGWLPITIAAIIGATLMVVTKCLTIDEAYRYIDWRSVFLIAGLVPLGIAMEQTGAATFLADLVIRWVGGYGPHMVLAGLFVLTALGAQFMPNPVVALLIAPIALSTAIELSISPYPLVLAVAIAASASFLTPVAHPANVLVMSPGGYRFSDYTRVGLPLLLLLLIVSVGVIPLFWPF